MCTGELSDKCHGIAKFPLESMVRRIIKSMDRDLLDWTDPESLHCAWAFGMEYVVDALIEHVGAVNP